MYLIQVASDNIVALFLLCPSSGVLSGTPRQFGAALVDVTATDAR